MDARKIIAALNEAAKIDEKATDKKLEKTDEADETGAASFEDMVTYTCPECEGTFTSDINIYMCECPLCGADIEPETGDELEVEEEFDISDMSEDEIAAIEEAMDADILDEKVFVRLGKKVTGKAAMILNKLRLLKSKGKKVKYDKKTGQIRAMTASEKAMAKKFGRRMKKFAGRNKMKRLKSMRKSLRVRQRLGASWDVNESVLTSLLNNFLAEAYENVSDTYMTPTIESFENAYEVGHDLVLECNVTYDDGKTDVTSFTIKDFMFESGTYDIVESGQIIVGKGKLKMTFEVNESESIIEPTKFDYNFTLGEEAHKTAKVEGAYIVEDIE